MVMENDVRAQLEQMSETEYQAFASKLLPETRNILGVRLPKLRKLAKKIAKEDWETYLKMASENSFEEVMLKGMVIGTCQMGVEQRLHYIADFIPKITNWSVCDSFCIGLKFVSEEPVRVLEFLKPYLEDKDEYAVRFAVVMLLDFYSGQQTEEVLELLARVSHNGYYAKMAVAWAVSVCFVKQPKQTMEFLKQDRLDEWTYHKSLQKITESLSVSPEDKAVIRSMKHKS